MICENAICRHKKLQIFENFNADIDIYENVT